MTSTATLAVETEPIIALETAPAETVAAEAPTSTPLQSITLEVVKQAIVSLIQEKNPDFIQLITDILTEKDLPVEQKEKELKVPIEFVKKERIPYSEMPFWKANPDLKPRIIESKGGLSKDFWAALNSAHEAFKDVSDEEWDEVLEDLKNDR